MNAPVDDPNRPAVITVADLDQFIKRLEELTAAVRKETTARRWTRALLAAVVLFGVLLWREGEARNADSCANREALRGVLHLVDGATSSPEADEFVADALALIPPC